MMRRWRALRAKASRCQSSRLANRLSLASSRTVRTSSSAGTPRWPFCRDAAEQLINGSGGLIEVVGEPGIGKTRLVDEAVAQVSDVTVLRCDCERTGAAAPYTPVRRLLHHVLGTSSAMDPNAIARCLQDCVTAAAPELAPMGFITRCRARHLHSPELGSGRTGGAAPCGAGT